MSEGETVPHDEDAHADIEQAIERAAAKTTVRDLEQRGFRNVKVLDHEKIMALVHQAVAAALARHGSGGGDAGAVEVDAQGEFLRLLGGSGPTGTAPQSVEALTAIEDRIKQVLLFLGDMTNRRTLAQRDLAQIDVAKDFDLRLAVILAKFLDLQVRDAHIAAKAEYLDQVKTLRVRVEAQKKALDAKDIELMRLGQGIGRAQAPAPAAAAAEAGVEGEEGLDLGLLKRLKAHGHYVKRSRHSR